MSAAARKTGPALLLALLGLALALRVWGVPTTLPYVYHADEPHNLSLVRTMIREKDPNPGEFHYPSLFLYAQAGGQLVRGVIDPDEGPQRDTGHQKLTLGNIRTEDPAAFVTGRMVTVLFGLGLVGFAFLATLRLTDRLGYATFAGALAALSPLAVHHGRLITPDAYAGTFSMAAVWAALLVLRRGSGRLYLLAGVLVGLAAASKYNAALAALPLVLAHFLRTGRRGFLDGRLYIAGAAAVAAFVAATPFAILDFGTFREHLLAEVRHYGTGHPGAEGGSLAFYAGTLWRKELPALVLALLGATVGARRFGGRETAVVAFLPFAYLLFIGRFPVHFERNLLPLLGPLFVLAACGLAVVHDGSRRLVRARPARAVAASVAAASLALPLVLTARGTEAVRTDERAPARRWLAERLPPGSSVAVEAYTPWVDPRRYDVHGTPLLITDDAAWYAEEGIEYVVASSKAYGTFLAERDRRPEEARLYRRLLGSFDEVGRVGGPEYWIRLYRVPSEAADNGTR